MRDAHDARRVALQDRISKELARNREDDRRAPALVEDLSIRTCRCRRRALLRGRRFFGFLLFLLFLLVRVLVAAVAAAAA